MMAAKLLIRLLSASTALSLLTPPAQAGSSGPKTLRISRSSSRKPFQGSLPPGPAPMPAAPPFGDPQAARRMRSGRPVNEVGAQPGTQPGERQPTRGERRPDSRGGQGASGPEKPDATQPRRAGSGAGDIE